MGYGDEIMASGEARRMKQADPSAKIVVGDGEREIWHEIFEGNPNVSRLADVGPGDRVVWLENYVGKRPYLDYARSNPDRQVFRPYRAITGDLFFSADEISHAATVLGELRESGRPLVSIEPNVDFGPNKDWGFERWQDVVDALRGRVTFVQPSYGKPLLAGVRAAPGTFRGYAAILAGCDLHLGPEGGLHHAAAALRRPAVVIFGGRTHSRLAGYAGHENLYRDVPGSPCGMVVPCEHCRRCLGSISVEEVVARAHQRLGLPLQHSDESRAPSDSRTWTACSVDLG